MGFPSSSVVEAQEDVKDSFWDFGFGVWAVGSKTLEDQRLKVNVFVSIANDLRNSCGKTSLDKAKGI